MPLMKVHIASTEIPAAKPLLARKLREVMIEMLSLDEKTGQVLLYDAVPQHRVIHSGRSSSFVFIEVLMYPGRTKEIKNSLMQGLVEEVGKILHVDAENINVCILEVPSENWYSGLSHN